MKKILLVLISLLIMGSISFADTFPIDIENCIVKYGRVELTGWYNERRKYGKHRAIDISANLRTPIRAFKAGKVIEIDHEYWSRNNPQAYGNYVVIEDRDGNKWLYAHMHVPNVKVNEYVSEGTVIGFVGWTGLPRPAAHLHMEKRDKNNNKIMFTKQLGDSVRKYLPNPKTRYTFTLR